MHNQSPNASPRRSSTKLLLEMSEETAAKVEQLQQLLLQSHGVILEIQQIGRLGRVVVSDKGKPAFFSRVSSYEVLVISYFIFLRRSLHVPIAVVATHPPTIQTVDPRPHLLLMEMVVM